MSVLMVATELRPSKIHSIGAFLLEPISKAQLVWRFDSRIDRVFSDDELPGMPPTMQSFLRTYSTLHDGLSLWVLCGDNGRHFNHSDEPTTVSLGVAFGDDIAAADLAAGAELTSNYATICDAVRLHGAGFAQRQPASCSSSLDTSLSPMSSR
jgi:hypothetical protein